MEEQLLSNSILDQFINSHEQSYEEFLNTFTYLLKEEEGKTIQGCKADSLRNTFSTSELSSGGKEDDGSLGQSEELSVPLPPQMPNGNKTEMSECWKASGPDGNNLRLTERVKVDKFLDLQDIDTDDETYSGEVEQTVTCSTLSFDQPVQQKFTTLSVIQPSGSQAQELLGDDVQPFSLDEEFDYDNVPLTPKFSEAELKAITDLSEKKKMETDVKSAGAKD